MCVTGSYNPPSEREDEERLKQEESNARYRDDVARRAKAGISIYDDEVEAGG